MHNPILGAASSDKWVERLSKEHNLLPYWVNLCRGPRRGLKTWSDPHGLGGAGEGLCTVLHPPSVQRSAAPDSFYGSECPVATSASIGQFLRIRSPPPPSPPARDVFERDGPTSPITHSSRPLDQANSDFMTSSIADA